MNVLITTLSILTFLLGLTFDTICDAVKRNTDISLNIDNDFKGTWVTKNSGVVQIWGDCPSEDCDESKSAQDFN